MQGVGLENGVCRNAWPAFRHRTARDGGFVGRSGTVFLLCCEGGFQKKNELLVHETYAAVAVAALKADETYGLGPCFVSGYWYCVRSA